MRIVEIGIELLSATWHWDRVMRSIVTVTWNKIVKHEHSSGWDRVKCSIIILVTCISLNKIVKNEDSWDWDSYNCNGELEL